MLENDVKSLAQLIFRAVDTPVGRECLAALEAGDPARIGEISVNPGSYADSESYFRDAQCVALLKKFDDVDKLRVDDLTEKAKQTFLACETQCARTNHRLADFVYGTVFLDGNRDERLWTYVQKVKRLLRSWLGDIPQRLNVRFGKGATMSDAGRLSTIMDKMSSTPTMTRNADICIPFWVETSWFRALASEFPHKSEPEVVPGNRFATVPKDCRKRRCIAVEPSLNIAYQLYVGRVLRARLKRIGIDLDEGQVLHRALAREASLKGNYATLDLSNASDTISRNLVKMLLPHWWHELLDSLRSPMTQVDGRWYLLEKFSSMGNGFTFELETLLFTALLRGLSDEIKVGKNLFVYGDDIIIDSSFADSAIAVLRWAGFTLNREKSFTSGPFRESCGGDYFEGRAVRPCFLKEAPSQPTDWIAMANRLYRTAVETYWSGDYEFCASRLRTADVLNWLQPAWAYCISRIPNVYRQCRGPYGRHINGQLVLNGDGWIYDSKEKWVHETKRGIRYFRMLQLTSRKRTLREYPGSVALAALVYGVPSEGMSPRGAPQYAHLRVVPFS